MKILVIDDLEINRLSAKDLEEDGHEVIVVGTAEEAVCAVRDEVPDMVLTDLWMPSPDLNITRESTWRDDGSKSVQVNNTWYNEKSDKHQSAEIPVGFVIAILAKNRNVQYIAILTDTDHHGDMLVTLGGRFDYGSGQSWFWEERRNTIGLYEARFFKKVDGSKDWRALAYWLINGKRLKR